MKDKIILHEAGIINIKLKNNRTHRFRIMFKLKTKLLFGVIHQLNKYITTRTEKKIQRNIK